VSLSPEQVNHFRTFGFVLMPGLLTADEAALMKDEADDMMAEARGGAAVDQTKVQAVQPFFERRPFMASLPADDRIYGASQSLCGENCQLMGTEGNLHVGDTPWHGGGEEHNMTAVMPNVKIVFYVDRLTRDTGALRVIPGSHRPPRPDPYEILRQRNDDADFRPFGVAPREIPCVCLDTQPGDVIFFTEDTLHAAFGGAPGRHQHAVSFYADPETDKQRRHIHDLYARFRFGLHPAESYINSENPRLRRIVSRAVEWGFESSKV
jgi:ectoine hydroxylase-related dioxygenase (phytanoyl-CoA dioxygenase family)